MVNLVTTYLKRGYKSYQAKIMVIGIHKCSNRKRINAIYVKDFKFAK